MFSYYMASQSIGLDQGQTCFNQRIYGTISSQPGVFQQVRRKLHRSNQTASLLPGQGFPAKDSRCYCRHWFHLYALWWISVTFCHFDMKVHLTNHFRVANDANAKESKSQKKSDKQFQVQSQQPGLCIPQFSGIGTSSESDSVASGTFHWMTMHSLKQLPDVMPPAQEYDSNWMLILPIYVYLINPNLCLSSSIYLTDLSLRLRLEVPKSWEPSGGTPSKARHQKVKRHEVF